MQSIGAEIDEVFEFVRDCGLYEVQITVMTAFPGTPLHERLTREGRVLRESDWSRCTLFDVNYQPKQMSVQELETGFADLMSKLYCPEEIGNRRKIMKDHLRTARDR